MTRRDARPARTTAQRDSHQPVAETNGRQLGGKPAGDPHLMLRSTMQPAFRLGKYRGSPFLALLLAAALLSGCSGATTQQTAPTPPATVAATPLPSTQMSQWLSFDAAKRTATLTIVANAQGTDNNFNFNGYSFGSLVITVPKGWKVTVLCTDHPYATYAHSCSVVSGPESKTAAFPGASLPDPTGTGFVTIGESKSFSFTPDAPFVGRFACLLIGHESAGMWATFQVTNAGQPSLGTRKPAI
jgi:uncharacterized cupredoxin-like copper-binding protein